MSEFTTYYPEAIKLEPHKRVNYVHGLVLGVDEFLQEEYYLLEKNRLHHRALHGYGTVYGLAVEVNETEGGHQILVRSGMAVSPKGQEICVPSDQCALLNEWLLQHRDEIESTYGSPPAGQISLYLVLCYRQCLTDRVPIPSGPCQSLEETSAPSRVSDDFILKLTTIPPEHSEDNTTRDLFDLLGQIVITDASPGLNQEELNQLVRDLAGLASPPLSSPPGSYTLHPDNAQSYLRNAFRVWVTEVRPHLVGIGACGGTDQFEACVQLARLKFAVNLTALGYEPVAPITLDQSSRPYLLSSRFVQEVLLSKLPEASSGGGVIAHSALSGLAVGDDHPQYLLADGSKSLSGNLNAANRKLTNLRDATAGRDALNLRTAMSRFVSVAAGTYGSIAAAGRFSADGDPLGPGYNGLQVISRPAVGSFVIHFSKYMNPDSNDPPRHTYIVRGTVEGKAAGIFQVQAFQNNGIRILSAAPATAAPTPTPATPLGFNVEITLISSR